VSSNLSANLFDLRGRVALVTGGNSGIGLALALGLRDAGASVAVAARRATRNAEALAQLGAGHAAFEMDVTDEASVQRTVAAVVERFGKLDVLVNNAGAAKAASVLEQSLEDWNRVIATDLTGPMLCTKYAARAMQRQGAGCIVNIASVYGLTAASRGRLISYVAAKHGLIGLTRVNAVELAPLGIRVNAIAPGWIHTEMTNSSGGFEQAVNRRTPLGRWGGAHELVGACVYLASDASGYATGSCLTVDGGYNASDGLDRE
jgi:NAD(P)-dependent dehydrogenase (short-subunit alcohol dehydrogenase family)